MNLGADLAALFFSQAAGLLLVAATVVFMVFAVRRGWNGWALLSPFLLALVACVPQVGHVLNGFWGAFITALDDLWLWLVGLGTVVLFAFACRILWRVQAKHRDAEPRGGVKVAIAIGFSLLLGFGGLAMFLQFQHDATVGTHDTLIKNLNTTIGEGKYLDAAKTVHNKPGIVAGQVTKLAGINATLATMDPSSDAYTAMLGNKTETWSAINATRKDIHDAGVVMRQYTPNHLVWVKAYALVAAGKDDDAESIIDRSVSADTVMDPDVLGGTTGDDRPCMRDAEGHCQEPFMAAPLANSFIDLHGNNVPYNTEGPRVFEGQREFNQQRNDQMRWLVYPGVTGLFLAPFAFVGGHILGKAFEPSSTVGYRRYPGKAAGFFLLLMGGYGAMLIGLMDLLPGLHGYGLIPPLDIFGVLAIPFGAWVLRDLSKRSSEGQIAL